MENKVLRRLLIVLTIIAILAFIACFGGFIYATIHYTMNKNANFVEEQATIIEYQKIEHGNNYNYYNLYYEYVAPDGMKYSGLYDSNIKNFDYIEKKLNTKITIYVDHDRQIHRLNKDDFNWSPIAFLCPASVMMFVFAMVPLLKLINYYKTKKRNDISKIVQEQPKEKLEKVEKNKNEKKYTKKSQKVAADFIITENIIIRIYHFLSKHKVLSTLLIVALVIMLERLGLIPVSVKEFLLEVLTAFFE